MIIELKPEQEDILKRAVQSGLSQEEALEQAFALLAEQFHNEEWLQANSDEIRAQIERGFAQAERGELIDGDEAVRILRERRAKRSVAMIHGALSGHTAGLGRYGGDMDLYRPRQH